MVRPTERHRELIADLAAERSALREAHMVGVGGAAAADQARLLNYMSDMFAVPNPAWFGKDKHSSVYRKSRAGWLGPALLRGHIALRNFSLNDS